MNSYVDPLVCGTAIAGIVILTCANLIIRSRKRETPAQPAIVKPAVQKISIKTPKWALRKVLELEPPSLTMEQVEALNRRKPPDIWNTVLIFPETSPNTYQRSFSKLKNFLQQAKISIYVAMYLCSNMELSEVIRRRHKDGLEVQVLTEYDTWTSHNSRGFVSLNDAGVPIRLSANGYLMHNKFVIIDDEALLTGSLNWTNQAVKHNFENILVTTDPKVVSKYLKEFNNLWHPCKSPNELINK